MKMNELIYKISEIFREDDTVAIYTYDRKICIYAISYTNIELRKIWRLIQQEKIKIDITANINKKVVIELFFDENNSIIKL